MFNSHTHIVDTVPCLWDVGASELQPQYPEGVHLSVGLHPWKVDASWREKMTRIRVEAERADVWAIGECGLDKVRGVALPVQVEAFRAQIAIAEEVGKPVVVHCVKAFDELLSLRREVVAACRAKGSVFPQPWIIHGFRGNPEQAKQLIAKGLFLSFGHRYQIETLRFVFTSSRPFFLETDDSPLSVRQIYEQVARHLDVDVCLLESLCDPRKDVFRQMAF